MRLSGKLERLLLVVGISLLAIYVVARIHGAVLARAEVDRFISEPVAAPGGVSAEATLPETKPDESLWSSQRIKDYEQSLAEQFSPPIAILRIPKIHVEVPVLEGTDDLTLNRGVGRIAGTANPGENGNIGIAGHRDGFFRGLKDVGPGDKIEMVTQSRVETYVVDHVVIVDPSDVSVLERRSQPSLTLVTCYPFYYLGSAPKRYIVQATVTASEPRLREHSSASTEKPDQQVSTR